jgi:hypothetical protein
MLPREYTFETKFDEVPKNKVEITVESVQLSGASSGVSCWTKLKSTYPDKDDESTHVDTDCVKTQGDGVMQFGSKHCFPIDRPLRSRQDREGKFEKRLGRRKVMLFEVWEKGGWFGKDSCRAHAEWPSDKESAAVRDAPHGISMSRFSEPPAV